MAEVKQEENRRDVQKEENPKSGDELSERKIKRKRKLLEEVAAAQNRGICYLSRIPPGMNLLQLRQILSKHGETQRIYLTPEDPAAQIYRKRAGGFRGIQFSEGWVEFTKKGVAEAMAKRLNGKIIGGKKRSQYYHDILNIKYLSKFKWDDLTGDIAYKNALREQRLALEESASRRQRDFYLSKVDKSIALTNIEERRMKKEPDKGSKGGYLAALTEPSKQGNKGSKGGYLLALTGHSKQGKVKLTCANLFWSSVVIDFLTELHFRNIEHCERQPARNGIHQPAISETCPSRRIFPAVEDALTAELTPETEPPSPFILSNPKKPSSAPSPPPNPVMDSPNPNEAQAYSHSPLPDHLNSPGHFGFDAHFQARLDALDRLDLNSDPTNKPTSPTSQAKKKRSPPTQTLPPKKRSLSTAYDTNPPNLDKADENELAIVVYKPPARVPDTQEEFRNIPTRKRNAPITVAPQPRLRLVFKPTDAGQNRLLARAIGRRYCAAVSSDELAKRNYADNIAEYNTVIASITAQRKNFLLRDVYDDMMLDGVKPERETFHSLLVGTLKQTRLQDALFFREQMKIMGLVPDVNLYHFLISICGKCKNHSQITKILEEMKIYDVKPTGQTFICLLHAFAASGSVDRVRAIVSDMIASGLGLNNFCYAGLIMAHANNFPVTDATVAKIIELVEQSKGWSRVEASRDTTENIMIGISEEDLYTLPTAEYVQRRGFLNRRLTVYHVAFLACADLRKVEATDTLLDMLRKEGKASDVFIVMQVMRCYLHSGDLDRGVQVFEEFMNSGNVPASEMFATLAEGAMVRYTEKGMQIAVETLEKMNSRRFFLGPKLSNDLLLVAAGEKTGGYTAANYIWDLMQSRRISPTAPVITAYYNGLKAREIPEDDPRLITVTRMYNDLYKRNTRAARP